MARFSEQFIQQVLQATDIVELISQYLPLTPKGREHVGLCPFHDDKKPSMTVSPIKQIYKCFACGAGGNSASFLMGYDKQSFPEAIRTLAERAGIPVPEDHERGPAPEPGMSKNDLLAVVAFADDYYQRGLRSPAGAEALAYARKRGLTDESIERFGLGYAGDAWEGLYTAARGRGFSEDQLVAAGLCKRRDSGTGCFDYFRHRLLFPIQDVTGRTVAFGGRALRDEDKAKYLNSPESALFDKSSIVFGLSWARDALNKTKTAVIVEGYFDVLLPSQEGVGNVVATLGTSLTDQHIRLLKRYVSQAVLVFDADAAGQKAAERGLQLFLGQQLHVRVATIPAGKDPCDYTLEAGGESMQALVDSAPDALQYVWDRRWAEYQAAGGNPMQRSQLLDEFLTLIANSAAWGAIDANRQQNLAQHIAHVLNVPAMELQDQMRRLSRRTRAPQSAPATVMPASGQVSGNPERHVLEVLLNEPDLFDDAAERIDPEDFRDVQWKGLAAAIWPIGMEGKLTLEYLLSMESFSSIAGLLTELSFTGQRRGNHQQTLNDAVGHILVRREQQETQTLRQTALHDDDALRALTQRLNQADPRKRPRIR